MRSGNEKKIIGLLGIGFDTSDGHIRITKGDKYDVYMGSEESHEYLEQLIHKIETQLEKRKLTLDDLTPAEFSEFVESIIPKKGFQTGSSQKGI